MRFQRGYQGARDSWAASERVKFLVLETFKANLGGEAGETGSQGGHHLAAELSGRAVVSLEECYPPDK